MPQTDNQVYSDHNTSRILDFFYTRLKRLGHSQLAPFAPLYALVASNIISKIYEHYMTISGLYEKVYGKDMIKK